MGVEGSQDGRFVDGFGGVWVVKRGGSREGAVQTVQKSVEDVCGVFSGSVGRLGACLFQLGDVGLETLLPAAEKGRLVGDERVVVVSDDLLESQHRLEAVVDRDGADTLEKGLVEKRVPSRKVRAQRDALKTVVLRDTLDRGVVDDCHYPVWVCAVVCVLLHCREGGEEEQQHQQPVQFSLDLPSRSESEEKFIFLSAGHVFKTECQSG